MHKNKHLVTFAQAAQAAEEHHKNNGNIPVAQVKTEATSNANVKSQDSSNENQDSGFFFGKKGSNSFNCGKMMTSKPRFSFATVKQAMPIDIHNVECKLKEDLAFGHIRNEDLPHIMLLDNQSTDNILNNPNLLTDVHQVPHGIKISTNGGGIV